MSKENGKDGRSTRKDPSEMQREYYKFLSGSDLPPDLNRIEAAEAIQAAVGKHLMDKGRRLLGLKSQVKQGGNRIGKRHRRSKNTNSCPVRGEERRSPLCVPAGVTEVVSGRLCAVEAGTFRAELLRDVSALVDLSGGIAIAGARPDLVHVEWRTGDNVDERLLEGLVRFSSSALRGRDQRVLLVGSRDSIAVVSCCVLREYLGCDAATALGILAGCGLAIVKPELIESVKKYQMS